MGAILEAVQQFFEEDDWPYSQLEGKTILRTGFSGSNGQWTCFAQAMEERYQFVFYSICPVKAAEDKRMAIAEFITRANYGMMIGNFELDFSDGEIRYKTSIDVEDDELTAPLIKQMLYANVLTMNRYLPGIMKVLSDVPVIDAIEEIEGVQSV
ncbi:MAG: YbjN domain-containing protein [Chloroflexia bacterium]|nr:YbjN domain-containing protein [Chloroflexia bacterium]